ncbi:hypothetical protein E4T47_02225 [Aureobasidium subglaciale]|nr:hypothetical protein E4T43_00051 [Aureobasidium subglaciale]KAI5274726.1 hypothetical protein E4T47_02225 [Aureobasidium subglaciale]
MSEAKAAISISPLLLRLADPTTTLFSVTAQEVAAAVSHIFANSISPVQTGCLLYALHTTQLDRRPDVLAACASSMRYAAAQVDPDALAKAVSTRARKEGQYHGGLVCSLTTSKCDIVGTGGDSHNTYNVSTTSSILASALLMMAKHGNNASTSKSGSADLLLAASPAPVIAATTEKTLPDIYSRTNYAFLYAREWHPGMRHAAAVRKELPFRTIFNLLGPLANPVQNSNLIEARILGVAKRDMGPVFAESMRLTGTKKALIVCGAEDLDELSCAGPSYCWVLRSQSDAADSAVDIVPFTVSPEDFGLKPVPLSLVAGGKSPAENAVILKSILDGTIDPNDPVLTFVLINTAALLVTSGICESETSNMGPGDDGKVITERGPGGLRWKEGVRRARWCISSGGAKEQWDAFVKVTGEIGGEQ